MNRSLLDEDKGLFAASGKKGVVVMDDLQLWFATKS
jgi:hypothetical protein